MVDMKNGKIEFKKIIEEYNKWKDKKPRNRHTETMWDRVLFLEGLFDLLNAFEEGRRSFDHNFDIHEIIGDLRRHADYLETYAFRVPLELDKA